MGRWQDNTCVVAWLYQADDGYYLEQVITGTSPPFPFVTEEEALIWMEVYLQRPHVYTKEDAISEILERYGEFDWFLDVQEWRDDAGLRLEVIVDKEVYPFEEDPLPRWVGPSIRERFYMVVSPIFFLAKG